MSEDVKQGHTPGSWRVSACRMASPNAVHPEAGGEIYRPLIEIADDQAPCPLLAEVYYRGDIGEMEANARLIAAAPELLEALKAIRATLTQNKTYPGDVDHAVKLANRAIQEAETPA